MKKLRTDANLIISVVLTLLVVFFAGFFGDYYFDLNDDVLMKDILSGAYTGTPAGHNIQMLYPISAFIALLYRAYRALDWYGIFLCTCQYLCVFIIFHRSLSLCGDRLMKLGIGAMEFAFMLGAVGSHFLFVQYTFTCGFLSAVAVFLILTRKAGDKRDLILPVVLITLAYLIRSEMLLLTLPMVGVGILCKWWLERLSLTREYESEIAVSDYGRKKTIFMTYVRLCVAIAVCLLASRIIHGIAYSPDDWRKFNSLFNARTELYDFQYIPDYDGNRDFYESIGLDDSQQQLLINYNFGLDERIDEDTLRAVAGYASELRTDETPLPLQLVNAIPSYLYRLRHVSWQKSYQYPMTDSPWNVITPLMYLGVFLFYLFSREKNKRLPVLLMLMLLFACRSTLWLYIIVRGRDPVRITHPMYLTEIAILAGMMLYRARTGRKAAVIPALAVAVAAAIFIPNQLDVISGEMSDRAQMREHYGALYGYFRDNPDNFYFVDVYTGVSVVDATGGNEATFSEKMFDEVDNNLYNHDLMGGWASKSPLYYEKLGRSGFESMEEALLRDDVYMVQLAGKDTGWLEDYYSDKGIGVTVKETDLVGDVFVIYKISALPGQAG